MSTAYNTITITITIIIIIICEIQFYRYYNIALQLKAGHP